MDAKRIFASGIVTICLSLAGAGPALADTGNGQGVPGTLGGPPGQNVFLQGFAQATDCPLGQVVSHNNGHGHNVDMAGGDPNCPAPPD